RITASAGSRVETGRSVAPADGARNPSLKTSFTNRVHGVKSKRNRIVYITRFRETGKGDVDDDEWNRISGTVEGIERAELRGKHSVVPSGKSRAAKSLLKEPGKPHAFASTIAGPVIGARG